MFCRKKPKINPNEASCDVTKLNKNEICNDYCKNDFIKQKEFLDQYEEVICMKYIELSKSTTNNNDKRKDTSGSSSSSVDDEQREMKNIFTANGVYSYYKSFVYKLLEIIHYEVCKHYNFSLF